jgi:Fur family peroxide stress response transcriptional regulator
MKRDPKELRRMMESFEEAIRRRGVRLTQQRIEIYREVAGTLDHPNIETIFKNVRRKLPTVSLDTVYRAMALFADLGLVTTFRPFDERARFDANTDVHHHFICTRCGATRDFEFRDFETLSVPEAAKTLGRVDSRCVELRGLCVDCMRLSPHGTDPRA